MATLLAENADHFVMHDGKAEFRVPREGLSEALITKIRGMGRKMAEGGVAMPELTVDDIDMGLSPQEVLSPEDAPTESDALPEAAPAGMVFEEGIDLTEPAPAEAVAEPVEVAAAEPVMDEVAEVVPAAPAEEPAPTQPAKDDRNPYDRKAEAAQEKFDAARRAGAAKNVYQQGYLDEAGKLAAREQEVRQSVQAAAKEYAARVQKAQEFTAGAGDSIDQGHYWASQSTGGKILGIIGLALGAIGASKDGVNRAALLMDKQIERDIQTQKLNYEMRLKKGAQMADSARSFYGLAKEIADNDLAAVKNAEALARKKLDVQLKAVDSSTDNLNAKSNLKDMIADNDIKRIKAEQDAAKIVSAEAHQKFTQEMSRRNTVAHELTADAAVKTAGLAQQNTINDRPTKLRKEFEGEKQVAEYRAGETSLQSLRSSLKAANATSDIAAINQFYHIIEPSSAVLPGEAQSIQEAKGLPERFWATLQKAKSGERMSPAQRKEIEALATEYQRNRKTAYKRRVAAIERQALKEGIPAGEVSGEKFRTATDPKTKRRYYVDDDGIALTEVP